MTASGKIVEIGKDVTRFEIGDRVNLINSMGAGCANSHGKAILVDIE